MAICGLALAMMAGVGCRGAAAPKASTGFPLVEKWRFRAGAEVVTTLGTDDDIVVARTGREVVALDVRTGAVRWRRSVPRGIFPLPTRTPVLVGEGLVVVAHYRGVMALDSRDGTIVWQAREPEPEHGAFPAAITPRSVYVVGYDLAVYERRTGAVRWRIPIPGSPRESAAAFPEQGVVYLSLAGRLQARGAASGALLWQEAGDRWPPVGTVLRGGKIYYRAAIEPVAIAAFDVASRRELWRTSVEAESYVSPPVLASGRIFLAPEGRPLALDAETGALLWQSTIWGGHYQGPALLDGVLYVREQFSRIIYALSAADGTELGHLTTGSPVWFPADVPYPLSPVAAGGLLLFATGDTVYAYGK